MTNDLLKELDALVANPSILDQNEARAGQRKPPFVKAYNEFEAGTKVSIVERDGKQFLHLDWTDMNIIHSDTPWTGTEDSEDIPYSERAISQMGFLLKSLAALQTPLSKIDGQRVHYKLDCFVPLNRDGTPRQRQSNDGRSFDVQIWHWDVVSVGKGAGAKADKPEMSDEEFDAALGKVVGLSHAEAMKEVGGDVISKGLLKKRIKQVEGVYVEASA